jgi:hypothetical protein
MFSKKFTTVFLRDVINTPATMTGMAHASNTVKQCQAPVPLTEVRVHNPPRYSYTVVNVNPYTLEEQLILYPSIVVSADNKQTEDAVISFK